MERKTKEEGSQKKKEKQADDDVEFVCTLETGEQHVTEPEEGEQHVTEPETERADSEPEGEIGQSTVPEPEDSNSRKRKRAPTMMKDIAKDPNSRVHVDFTFMGEPY